MNDSVPSAFRVRFSYTDRSCKFVLCLSVHSCIINPMNRDLFLFRVILNKNQGQLEQEDNTFVFHLIMLYVRDDVITSCDVLSEAQ